MFVQAAVRPRVRVTLPPRFKYPSLCEDQNNYDGVLPVLGLFVLPFPATAPQESVCNSATFPQID